MVQILKELLAGVFQFINQITRTISFGITLSFMLYYIFESKDLILKIISVEVLMLLSVAFGCLFRSIFNNPTENVGFYLSFIVLCSMFNSIVAPIILTDMWDIIAIVEYEVFALVITLIFYYHELKLQKTKIQETNQQTKKQTDNQEEVPLVGNEQKNSELNDASPTASTTTSSSQSKKKSKK